MHPTVTSMRKCNVKARVSVLCQTTGLQFSQNPTMIILNTSRGRVFTYFC